MVERRVIQVEGLHPLTRSLRKLYGVQSDILQAILCEFQEDGKELAGICVREASCLTLFMESGAVHYVPLPFPVSA